MKKSKKVIETIKKHDNIFILIIILISTLVTFKAKIESGDEIWTFQNIYKMYNGYKIYNDANVIQTPLFFYIGKILFEIIGANILTHRIYNIIIQTSLLLITYTLLKQLKINKKISILLIIYLILQRNYGSILMQANYNTLAILFFVLGILIQTKKYKHNNIIQGIILFLVTLSKQNIGILYGLAIILNEITQKSKIKEKIKNIAVQLAISTICIIITLAYFNSQGYLNNFISYTILGIGEFAGKNTSIGIDNIIETISLLAINLIVSRIFIKKEEKLKTTKEEKENLIMLNCYAIPLTLSMYPIFNQAHYIGGIYVTYILFTYIINIMLKRIEIKSINKIINILVIIGITVSCSYSTYSFVKWEIGIKDEKYPFSPNQPFYGGLIEQEQLENINKITEYIRNSESKVIVLSNKAALYMIPLKQSNGEMDLPFKGNLGKEGENGLIQKLKAMKNVRILLEKEDTNDGWQESKIAKEYIKNNWKKEGEIEEFYIYKQN